MRQRQGTGPRELLCRILSLAVLGAALGGAAMAQDIPPADGQIPPADGQIAGGSLYLDVFINGQRTDVVAEFQQGPDGELLILPEDLPAIGLKDPTAAVGSDGRVALSKLPGLSYDYDEQAQAIHLQVANELRLPRLISARGKPSRNAETPPSSAWGAVLNYDLYGSTATLDERWWSFSEPHLSGLFESRFFSPAGVLSNAMIGHAGSDYDLIRTNTTWSYSDPERMRTYRAGDFISSSLSWTRPVRLGGLQAQRNFGLRSDLITTALPSISGSAAVPSTIEVYTDGINTYSGSVADGPFTITELPAADGGSTTRLVVVDALGRETVVEAPFYASSQLLAPGMFDYSLEAGLARRSFGLLSNDYDERIAGSGSARYGVTDWFTLESHAEGNEDLLNGAAGVVTSVRGVALVSLGGAASLAESGSGSLVSGGIETGIFGARLKLRSQRTFGDYQDLVSISSEVEGSEDEPPEATDQAVLSIPLGFDPSIISVSYTRIDFAGPEEENVFGLSFSRTLPRNSQLFASGYYVSGEDDGLRIYAGLRIPFGKDISATSSFSEQEGGRYSAQIAKPAKDEPGSIGWRLGGERGEFEQEYASASYRSSVGEIEAGIRRSDSGVGLTVNAGGAVVVAGGGVFIANRINDAFAVVDAGAPNVTVLSQNRVVGKTGRGGKILVPDLAAHRPNQIAIDQDDLPLTAQIPSTNEIVVPREKSGVVVDFGVGKASAAALVTFRDRKGEYLAPGLEARLAGGEAFLIGYDGQAYMVGLKSANQVTVEFGDGRSCRAEFTYAGDPQMPGVVEDVVCL